MNSPKYLINNIIQLSLLLFIPVIFLSAQITQKDASQNTAGGTAQSTSFLMVTTIGQSSPPGTVTSGQYILQSGFLSSVQDTLGDLQAPAAPMNLSTNPSEWTNINNFTISWDSPEPTENIGGIWYKIGLPPTYDEDGLFLSIDTNEINNIMVDSTGNHLIYLWLQDKNGNRSHINRAETNLLFDNIDPPIEHNKITSVPVNSPINVNADAFDVHSQLAKFSLYYQMSGDESSLDSTQFVSGIASIPASINTQRGTQYKIIARDYAGNESGDPAEGFYSIQAELSGEGGFQTNESGQPVSVHNGSKVNDYRIFSVPFELDNNIVSAVFEDDLGPVDDTKWLLFDIYHGSLRDYNTIKSLGIVNPGKGFLLIANEPDIVIDGGKGISPDLNIYNHIPLESGWNLIGNPYDFDIPLNNLSLNGATPEAWYLGDNGWQNNPTHLKKWEGLAIYTANAATLNIVPVEGQSMAYSIEDRFYEENWGIRIIAIGDESNDPDNFIGVFNPDNDNDQRNIWHEAPRLLNSVALAVKGEQSQLEKENVTGEGKFSTCLQPWNDKGYSWGIEVEGEKSGSIVSLDFKKFGNIPTEFSRYLIDTDLKMAFNLEEIDWSHKVKTTNKVRHFKIVIGNQEFTEKHSEGINLIANEFSLRQNFPNPFNPYTTIIFTLPDREEVTLDIFNIMGQKIKTIISKGYLDAGYHSIEWDGSNSSGDKVASGVYIYRIKAGNFVTAKKAILSR